MKNLDGLVGLLILTVGLALVVVSAITDYEPSRATILMFVVFSYGEIVLHRMTNER